MQDMSELERRLSAALDRIATHVVTLHPAAPEPAEAPAPAPEEDTAAADLPDAADLLAELESERAVTAQLEERVRAIKEKQDTRVAELESDLAAARNRVAALEEENEGLREGATAAAEDDRTVAALRSELEALREARAEERAELARLLAELKPIVEENASA